MAYQALYRKWRPTTFDDVVGQEHITQTLKNQIINSQLAHAYLFCGTRGTGKTSTAKILARAVNCENPINGNPCNECSTCRGILDESIMDVVEMDGASRNKIENIREIIDDALFLPSVAKKKVYIIDEVHMVSTAAFNALLKTLEEPPEHVMFILATTELNKVPATVLSRCQRFDFRRITNEDISSRLDVVAKGSGKNVTKEALSLVAELGNGSMRDSLSILEQCIGYTDETLTYDDIINIIGIADLTALFSISEAIIKGNGAKCLSVIDDVLSCGKELDVFVDSLAKFLRDLLVVKLMSEPEKILTTSASNLEKMRALCENVSQEKLVNSLNLLNESILKAKNVTFKRTIYELAIVKMCDVTTSDTIDALLARVAELEEKLKNGEFSVSPAPKEKVKKEDNTKQSQNVSSPQVKEKPVEIKRDMDISAKWDDIKAHIKTHGGQPLIPHLACAKPVVLKDKLALVFSQNALMSKTVASKQLYLDLVHAAVLEVLGLDLPVGCFTDKEVLDSNSTVKADSSALDKLEDLAKKHNIIEIMD
ncbi:MAG: DNA polymerase III subunit gamma/tau [Ruminococcaceae bacterium]|nr:DNA polymerase III subunit gamma/tau [Oscillospiraceae bacterium]